MAKTPDMKPTDEVPMPEGAFVFQLTGHAKGRSSYKITPFAEGLTSHDLARFLLRLGTDLICQTPVTYASVDQQKEIARAREIIEKYPAVQQFPEAEVQLCVACVDLYEDLLEGPGYPMPPGGPIPCSFHLHPDQAPIPLDAAVERRVQLDTEEEETRRAEEKNDADDA